MSNYSKLTLEEIKNICINHLGHARDCETCPVYKLCNKYFNYEYYPSGWKLEAEVIVENDCSKIKK